jgi:hypothetical protein
MKKLTDGSLTPEIVASDNRLRCHSCKAVDEGGVYAGSPPRELWFPEMSVREFTQQLVIMTRKYCCGAISHTEPVATVSACLRPVKENARLMCNLMNQYLLAGRPEPQWLTDAWTAWDERFIRGHFKTRRAS